MTRGFEKWPWPSGMLGHSPRTLQGATSRVLTADALLERELVRGGDEQ